MWRSHMLERSRCLCWYLRRIQTRRIGAPMRMATRMPTEPAGHCHRAQSPRTIVVPDVFCKITKVLVCLETAEPTQRRHDPEASRQASTSLRTLRRVLLGTQKWKNLCAVRSARVKRATWIALLVFSLLARELGDSSRTFHESDVRASLTTRKAFVMMKKRISREQVCRFLYCFAARNHGLFWVYQRHLNSSTRVNVIRGFTFVSSSNLFQLSPCTAKERSRLCSIILGKTA